MRKKPLTGEIRGWPFWKWAILLPLVFLMLWSILPLFVVPYRPTWFMVLICGLCGAGIFLLFHPKILPACYRALWRRIWGKGLLILFHAALLFGVGTVVLFTVWMAEAAGQTPESGTPLLVCGARITEEGPAPVLTARLNTAVQYLEENPEALCVVTGGRGADEPKPEGEAMGEYLREKGIAPERILVENRSVNTEENTSFGVALLREHGYNGTRLAVCTDGVHQYRAQYNIKRLGLTPSAVSAPVPWYQLLNHWIRELLAVAKTAFLTH